jgi:hypothetical protein
MINNLLTPYFVDFWEKYRPWIAGNQPRSPEQWTPPLNFARMMRNWISHHRGRVNFPNPNDSGVTWEHISYYPSDKDKQAFGGDLVLGDLLLLIFEVAEALSALSCPLDP